MRRAPTIQARAAGRPRHHQAFQRRIRGPSTFDRELQRQDGGVLPQRHGHAAARRAAAGVVAHPHRAAQPAAAEPAAAQPAPPAALAPRQRRQQPGEVGHLNRDWRGLLRRRHYRYRLRLASDRELEY